MNLGSRGGVILQDMSLNKEGGVSLQSTYRQPDFTKGNRGHSPTDSPKLMLPPTTTYDFKDSNRNSQPKQNSNQPTNTPKNYGSDVLASQSHHRARQIQRTIHLAHQPHKEGNALENRTESTRTVPNR
ncbi:hypothetical protein NL676_016177 [Syzygium grande]|nr:hypothetical protein NL676_016177 [Syzygium grande]